MAIKLTELSLHETQKRVVMNARLARWMEQFEALNEQYDDCFDAGEQVVLASKIKKLDSKIEKLEADLSALDQTLKGEESTGLSEKLPYIDFKEVIQSFRNLLDYSGKQGGVSFLVLQNSRNMGGDLLMRRLREELKDGANLKPHRVGFSGGIELNEMGLLKGISKILGINAGSSSLDQLLEDVVDKICASVETRSVVLIEIAEWHKLPMQEKVFSWLCSDFYTRLADKFSETVSTQWRRVHILLIVVSDERISDNCLNVTFPLLDFSDSGMQDGSLEKAARIFNVSLDNWSEDDIEGWLEFTGLPDNKLEDKAKRLHESSFRGIPRLVVDAIEREFIFM